MKAGYEHDHIERRRAVLASHPSCYWCGAVGATIADHDPPLSTVPAGHRWRGVVRPSCVPCSQRQSGQLAGIRKRLARGEAPPSRPW